MNLHRAIQSQYHAALDMLQQAIEQCPDDLWDAPEPSNRFWHVAYHNLFYVHLYLQKTEADFTPWEHHREEYHDLGHRSASPEDASVDESDAEQEIVPYTKEEVLHYLDFCRQEVDVRTAELDLEAASGFYWISLDKTELQFYNIRHLQHHTGELAERLGTRVGVEVGWVGKGKRAD